MPIVRLPSREINIRPMRLPSPVFFKPRELRMATTISQISGLEKLLRASVMAPFEEVEVTCDRDTITMAIIAITPIGITFKIIATMVVRKIATSDQALGVKPSGVGSSNSVISTSVEMMAGTSRNGTASLKCRNISLIVLYIIHPFKWQPQWLLVPVSILSGNIIKDDNVNLIISGARYARTLKGLCPGQIWRRRWPGSVAQRCSA